MTRERAAGVAILSSVGLFSGLVLASMAKYPGGTWFDPNAPGHDVFRNFLCDLTQPVALNGAPNPTGAILGKASMLVLGVGLLLVWWAMPWLLEPPLPRHARWMRALGSVSFAGTIAVPLTPSLRLGVVHAVAVIAAATSGLAAGAVAMSALRRRPALSRLARIGTLLAIVSAVDAALYADHTLRHTPGTLLLPALQRVALVLLMVWIVEIGLRLTARTVQSRET